MTNKKNNKLGKIIIALIAVIVIIILLLLRSCSKKQDVVDNTGNNNETKVQEVVQEPNQEVVEETITEETVKEEEAIKNNDGSYSYWVNFLNKDGSVLQRTAYKYGSTPEYKGNTPTYEDGSYYYSFKGWDKTISTVTGTQIYTALYDITGAIARSTPAPTVTPNYLTFTANTAGSTIVLNEKHFLSYVALDAKLQYRVSSNNVTIKGSPACMDWTNYDFYEFTLPKNEYVQFRANPNNINISFSVNNFNYYFFSMNGSIAASGDVTSLLNGVGGDVALTDYCFFCLFNGCTSLTTAPALPATTLANSCYYGMFNGCTNLKTAPSLPATTLANECYYEMFNGCTSLISAPDLPAETLANYCYYSMFYGCESLVSAPSLPATTLADYCYNNMFYGCTSLTTAPALPATTLANGCYSYMFQNCLSLASLQISGNGCYLPATTLASNCYERMFVGCTSLQVTDTIAGLTNYGIIVDFTNGGKNNAYYMFYDDANPETKTYYWYTEQLLAGTNQQG